MYYEKDTSSLQLQVRFNRNHARTLVLLCTYIYMLRRSLAYMGDVCRKPLQAVQSELLPETRGGSPSMINRVGGRFLVLNLKVNFLFKGCNGGTAF